MTAAPAAPGVHDLACRVWRPRGSLLDRFAAFFVGGAPELKDGRLRYGFEDVSSGAAGEPETRRLMRSAGSQRLRTGHGARGAPAPGCVRQEQRER